MPIWFALALGAAVAGVPALVAIIWLARRLSRMRAEAQQFGIRSTRRGRILDCMPDGLYVWDHNAGGEICSARLAVLLGLASGTKSPFREVLNAFDDDARRQLQTAVDCLREEGRPFDMMLPLGGDIPRTLHIIGRRAPDGAGQPALDLVWMRDAEAVLTAAEEIKAEGARLAEEGERLRVLLDTVPVPIWLRNVYHDIVAANAATPPGFAGRALAVRAAERERPQTETTTLKTPDGPQRFTITEVPLGDEKGMVGYGVPVNDVDRSALAVRFGQPAAEPSVLDSLPAAVAVYGADTRLRYANDAYRELWSLEPSALAGRPTLGEVLALLREKRRLPEFADFAAYREGRLALFDTLDGPQESLLHLPDNATVREIVTRDVAGGLVFFHEDVTARLELESSYQTAVAVQRESLDNLHEGVCVLGVDGRMRFSNLAFATLWNLPPEELAKQPRLNDLLDLTEHYFVTESWSDLKANLIARLMSRESTEGRMTRADGTTLKYSGVPLPDGGVLITFLDITDSARVERALRERAEAMSAADRLKSEFIASLSYELRTPLNSINGFIDVLTGGYHGDLNPRQKEYADGIGEAAQNLLSLLDDVIDLASIEAGTLALKLDSVDLHTLLSHVVGLMRQRAQRHGLDLEFDCPAEIGWVIVDENRLKQVLYHLLSNAVKFTPSGGTVCLEAVREADQVRITVADTGVGIPKEDQERIFTRFEKGAPDSSDTPGAGLGLTLVKRFIDLHGGAVALESAPEKGTRVTCTLPLE